MSTPKTQNTDELLEAEERKKEIEQSVGKIKVSSSPLDDDASMSGSSSVPHNIEIEDNSKGSISASGIIDDDDIAIATDEATNKADNNNDDIFSFVDITSIGDPKAEKKKLPDNLKTAPVLEIGKDKKDNKTSVPNQSQAKKEKKEEDSTEFDWEKLSLGENALSVDEISKLKKEIRELYEKSLEMKRVAGSGSSVFKSEFFMDVANDFIASKEEAIATIILDGSMKKIEDEDNGEKTTRDVMDIFSESVLLSSLHDDLSLLSRPVETTGLDNKAHTLSQKELEKNILGTVAKVFNLDLDEVNGGLRRSETLLYPSFWFFKNVLSVCEEDELLDFFNSEFEIEYLTKLYSEDILEVFAFS